MRRRHRKTRKERRKQRKIIIVLMIGLFFVMSAGYAAFQTNLNITAKGTIKVCTVTFDANGGTVDIKSKRVKYGSNYGALPTPIRDGYTFKGWHGKNMYNFGEESDYFTNFPMEINPNEQSITATNHVDWAGDYWRNELNKFAPGTYFISFSNSGLASVGHIIFTYDEKGNIIDNSSLNISAEWNEYYKGWYSSNQEITLTIPSTVAYWKYGARFAGNIGLEGKVYNILIENIEENPKWEPYFITNETEVVQKKDHTLTAIWEKN